MDWNVKKDQQGTNVLSSRLLGTVLCCFFSGNVSNWHRKWQKTQNSPIFKSFYAFFDKISTVFLDSKDLKGQKETFRCPIGFFEEIIAVL